MPQEKASIAISCPLYREPMMTLDFHFISGLFSVLRLEEMMWVYVSICVCICCLGELGIGQFPDKCLYLLLLWTVCFRAAVGSQWSSQICPWMGLGAKLNALVLGAGGYKSRKPCTGEKQLSLGELGVWSVLLFNFGHLSYVVAGSWKILVRQALFGAPFCFNVCFLFLVVSVYEYSGDWKT